MNAQALQILSDAKAEGKVLAAALLPQVAVLAVQTLKGEIGELVPTATVGSDLDQALKESGEAKEHTAQLRKDLEEAHAILKAALEVAADLALKAALAAL